MARSIEQIKTSMAEAFMQDTNLAIKYGFEVGADFNNTFSKVSIESLLLYIVAVAIWTLEKLFDTHTKEVTDYIATMKPHSLRWYVGKAKAFMYGYPLIEGTDQYNTEGMEDEDIAAAKIITFAACTESEATLYLKVARSVGGHPAALDDSQKSAFKAYLQEIKDAGVRIDVISEEGDYLKLDMVIYYDPLILNEDGENKSTGEKTVEIAIKQYIENIPFNGEFRKNELVDTIQAVPGVEMVELNSCYHSETGTTGTFEEVIAYCKPISGYFKFENADISQVIYRAYAD